MKKLIIILLLSIQLFATETTQENKSHSLMECEMMLEMFNFGVEQGNPITKEQLLGVITTCKDYSKHKDRIESMKKALLRFEEV